MSKEATKKVPENAPSNENSWASSWFVSSFKPPENHSKINFSFSPLLLITLPRILSAPCFLSNPQFRRIPPSLQPISQQFPLFPLSPFMFFPCLHSPRPTLIDTFLLKTPTTLSKKTTRPKLCHVSLSLAPLSLSVSNSPKRQKFTLHHFANPPCPPSLPRLQNRA